VVIVPKYRRKILYGKLRRSIGEMLRQLSRTQGSLFGLSFWTRRYFVSTVGIDEGEIRHYIKQQEELQKKQIEFDFD
jgi:putative transposase